MIMGPFYPRLDGALFRVLAETARERGSRTATVVTKMTPIKGDGMKTVLDHRPDPKRPRSVRPLKNVRGTTSAGALRLGTGLATRWPNLGCLVVTAIDEGRSRR